MNFLIRLSKIICFSFIYILFISCGSNSKTQDVVANQGTRACSSPGSNPSLTEQEITKIPDDVTTLFVSSIASSPSNKVVLYSIGGPVDMLFIDKLFEGGFRFNPPPYFERLGITDQQVYVHQANTFNPRILNELGLNLSFERAIQENQVSVEMLYRVAKHFIGLGKEVYIVSHSFGSFIVPAFMLCSDLNIKKYLVMAGRLDMPAIVWQGFRDGDYYQFSDGNLPVKVDAGSGSPEIVGLEAAQGRLQAGVGINRFTELLRPISLTNLIYSYAENDVAVGRLQSNEIDFLKSKGAQVDWITISSIAGATPGSDPVIIPANHSSFLTKFHAPRLKDLLFR